MHGVFKLIAVTSLSLFLSGCFLIPKKVEMFQDKVEAVPAKTDKQEEFERQAAKAIDQKVEEAYIAAIKEDSSTNVTKPLGQAHAVAPALSTSLGPPKQPYTGNPTNLAASLNKGTSKLNSEINEYREDVTPNVGKKIEGTGLIQMPYIVALGISLLLLWVISIIYKIASAAGWFHPAVGIGMNALKIPAKLVSKIASEAIEGGEEFKNRLEKEITSPETVEKVKKVFAEAHAAKQSRDTQQIIRDLTRK